MPLGCRARKFRENASTFCEQLKIRHEILIVCLGRGVACDHDKHRAGHDSIRKLIDDGAQSSPDAISDDGDADFLRRDKTSQIGSALSVGRLGIVQD